MRYCKKCTMPDTRPGITFDAEGVCSACRHYENRKNVDWDARFKEFEAYCDKYRGMNGPGGYDCAVAVSGGKDSHFQVWMLKEVMHMNPILFSVEDNFPMTQAGIHNLKNISEERRPPDLHLPAAYGGQVQHSYALLWRERQL